MDVEDNITMNDPNASEIMQVENETLNPEGDCHLNGEPMSQELMNALNLTNATYNSDNGDPNNVYKMRMDLPAYEEVVSTASDFEEEKEKEVINSCTCSRSAEDEKSINCPVLPIAADGENLVAQSYYITFDENGEQYAVLTLENSSVQVQERKSVAEVSKCTASSDKQKVDEKSVIQTLDNAVQRSYTATTAYNGTAPPIPAYKGQQTDGIGRPDLLIHQHQDYSSQDIPSLTFRNPPSQTTRLPALQESRWVCNCDSNRLQPYCERPLKASTPTSSTYHSRLSYSGNSSACTPSCSSYSSINLNSGGEETSSSSDNSSMNLPRAPHNTPESNVSMSSMPPPNLPLTQSLFNATLNPSSGENMPLRAYRKLKLSNPTMGPKEMHNEKERFRRGRIKKACLMMRNTVPGLTEKTDKATVLESAVRYMFYLKSNLGRNVDKEFLEKWQQL